MSLRNRGVARYVLLRHNSVDERARELPRSSDKERETARDSEILRNWIRNSKIMHKTCCTHTRTHTHTRARACLT